MTLGVPGMRNALQSLQNEPRVFLQNELPVLTLVNHFIYVVVTHPFSGIQEAVNLPWEGEEKKEDVWAPPGALLYSGWLRGIARKPVYARIGKGNNQNHFLLKGLFLCRWMEHLRSKSPGRGPGFCMSPC